MFLPDMQYNGVYILLHTGQPNTGVKLYQNKNIHKNVTKFILLIFRVLKYNKFKKLNSFF
jgi:hypothetical protein